ncbi:MAG: phage major capsid protein [Desulfomicrobium sp.]|nr:phage major capsid protein [Desulfomicrobium sp.]
MQHFATGTSGAFRTGSATVSPADDLIDMVYGLKAAYRQGACWQMNSKTLSVIRKWKDLDGNYIWQKPMAAGQPGQILGYDVVENEAMPDPGAGALPIMFGNFQRAYVIVDRIGIRLIRDPYTNKPYVHFYTTKRVGGALVNSEAVKFLKMSAS